MLCHFLHVCARAARNKRERLALGKGQVNSLLYPAFNKQGYFAK
jgi:hypothetical protein